MTAVTISQGGAGEAIDVRSVGAIGEHAARMSSLSSSHDILVRLIGKSRFHYVDIPVHGNIGDLLIMHGTMAFFGKNGLKPSVVAPAFAYRPEWVKRGDVVVFHGGGNFGDLYSEYGGQPLREKMVEMFPGNRIIVLPQTIHFSSTRHRRRSAGIFRSHPDVHLCVRDELSREIAKEFTDHVYLLPDMAHQLYPIVARINSACAGTLLISRTDAEKLVAMDATPKASTKSDWPELVGTRERRIDQFRRAMRLLHRCGMAKAGGGVIFNAWMKYSGMLIADAADLFASHEQIVTDRLHGHILACLMDKSSIVVDNFYGKNSTYVNAWTVGSSLVALQKR